MCVKTSYSTPNLEVYPDYLVHGIIWWLFSNGITLDPNKFQGQVISTNFMYFFSFLLSFIMLLLSMVLGCVLWMSYNDKDYINFLSSRVTQLIKSWIKCFSHVATYDYSYSITEVKSLIIIVICRSENLLSFNKPTGK